MVILVILFTGVLRWSFAASGPIVASPALGVDLSVFFGSKDKIFYALSAAGAESWRFVGWSLSWCADVS